MSTNHKILTVCYPWIRTRRGEDGFIDQIFLGTHNDTPGARRLHMVDKRNGAGGKFDEEVDPSIRHSARRETEEEFGIKLELGSMIEAGIVRVNNNGYRAEIHFFFANEWTGNFVRESREFRDIRRFDISDLPYPSMMDADKKYRLPYMMFSAMMRGEILCTSIVHDENMIVTSCTQFTYSKR